MASVGLASLLKEPPDAHVMAANLIVPKPSCGLLPKLYLKYMGPKLARYKEGVFWGIVCNAVKYIHSSRIVGLAAFLPDILEVNTPCYIACSGVNLYDICSAVHVSIYGPIHPFQFVEVAHRAIIVFYCDTVANGEVGSIYLVDIAATGAYKQWMAIRGKPPAFLGPGKFFYFLKAVKRVYMHFPVLPCKLVDRIVKDGYAFAKLAYR